MVGSAASKCADVCKLDVSAPNFDGGNIRERPAVAGPVYCPSNADAGNKSRARSFIWGIAPYFIKPIYHFGLLNQWDAEKSRVSTEARGENTSSLYSSEQREALRQE